jgi:uncharacterized protein
VRIWIDFANAPQVRVLEPIVDVLQREGHSLLLTARNHRDTAQLGLLRWPELEVDGASSPGGPMRKATAIADRALALRRRAKAFSSDVALSHNSYAQLAAARLLRIPSITAMDYEHQPANHVAFRLATVVIVPECFPPEALRRFGAREPKVRRYRGLKEQAYVKPAGEAGRVREQLGVREERPLAVVRLPPDRALYHPKANPLVEEVIATLRRQAATILILGRSDEQRAAWQALAGRDLVVAPPALDTDHVLVAATIFIGAGGTMTREAALLGTPTFSIFAGKPAAVDRWLEAEGRLVQLRAPDDVRRIDVSSLRRLPVMDLRLRGGIVETVLSALRDIAPREERRPGNVSRRTGNALMDQCRGSASEH